MTTAGITIGLTEGSKSVTESSQTGFVQVCAEVHSGAIDDEASVEFALSVTTGTAGM